MTFETGNGRRIDVDRKLAVGGEGEVFAVSSPQGFVFKKYLPVAFSRDRALERRLNTMVRYPPPEWREPRTGHVTLAWLTRNIVRLEPKTATADMKTGIIRV